LLDLPPMSIDPKSIPSAPIELLGTRRGLDGPGGPRFWKSLDELAETQEFREFVHREFPEQASQFEDPEGRREFLKIMGASLALAGLGACTRQPQETILPYVKQPEQVVPGRSLFFASAVTLGGYAKGVLVESHEGRPTKVEGNPDHPQSLGATDVFGQAHVLGLYDPDRAQTVKFYGEVRTWAVFNEALRAALEKQRGSRGAGLRFLSGTVTSPTLRTQLEGILAEFPAARWHQYEPAGRDNVRAGAILAFGEPVEAQYRLERADVILSLDQDFVGSGPANLRLVREFASRRRVQGERAEMNRLYVVESTVSAAGAVADHRLPLRASEVEGFARAVAAALGLPVEGGTSAHAAFIAALAKDLRTRAGASLVMAGEGQPPAVHALAHAMNQALGSVGKTVVYTDPPEAKSEDQLASLKELGADMEAGRVELLIILGSNPVYNAPADLEFARRMDKVGLRIHLGLYEDETGERCHWTLPEAHPLEAWSDARAVDGTVSILQPLIAPLYGGRSAHEVLAAFGDPPDQAGYDIVREHWRARGLAADFEKRWARALHDGVVAGSALPEKRVTLKIGPWSRPADAAPAGGLEIVFRPDPSVWDGSFANNGWLQELPKPLTKLTWENAALLSPATAARLGLPSPQETSRGAVSPIIELQYKERRLRAPAWIVPGHPDDSVTVHLGYGRTRVGRVGNGAGFSAYALRTSGAPWFDSGLEVRGTGETTRLACTQNHWSMEGRHPVRVAATTADYDRKPHFAREMGEDPRPGSSLFPPHKYEGHAWGMAIDLNACVGCNACVTACQSENNIPVVGKDQVARGREMHWIRVDRYYEGDPGRSETIEAYHQPLPCMHCENAPCEVVCPVAATVHSDEGLNEMVYNRCVGTRYCSNNCPYKVRRFNFFLYQDWDTPSLKMMRNPDVTVRSRGVMEKCTYCVQRINRARIEAKNEGRGIREGEIKTACQSVCPAEAIVFGDVNDPKSRVSRLKAEPRNYGLLSELQTQPRTTYLAAVRNPNPEISRG
jgi:MoCo/4Fe-4S cofactor protein with predicted Tat translocation signal